MGCGTSKQQKKASIVFIAAKEQRGLVERMKATLTRLTPRYRPLDVSDISADRWHVELKAAEFVIVLLSKEFVLDSKCEADITFAYDCNRVLLPIMVNLDSFMQAMKPERTFLEKHKQLERRVPKLNSILNRCNRLPPTGAFVDHYDNNMKRLVDRVNPEESATGANPANVVLSYQSGQEEVLLAVRNAVRNKKINTVDGKEVPVGEDWRQFYFMHLFAANVFVAIISPQYLASRACEDEITYAYDCGKTMLAIIRMNSEEDQIFRQQKDLGVPNNWDKIGYARIQRFRALCKRIHWIPVPDLPTTVNECTSVVEAVSKLVESPRVVRQSDLEYAGGSVLNEFASKGENESNDDHEGRITEKIKYLLEVILLWDSGSSARAALDLSFIFRDPQNLKLASQLSFDISISDTSREKRLQRNAPELLTEVIVEMLSSNGPVDAICIALSNLVGRPDNMDLGRFSGDEELVRQFETNLQKVKKAIGSRNVLIELLNQVDPSKIIEASRVLTCLNNLITDLDLRRLFIESDWVPRVVECLNSQHKIVRIKASSLLHCALFTFQHRNEAALNIYAKCKFCEDEERVNLVTRVLLQEFEEAKMGGTADINLMENLAWVIQNISFIGAKHEEKYRSWLQSEETVKALGHLIECYDSERAAGAIGPMGFNNPSILPLIKKHRVVEALVTQLKKRVIRPHWDSPLEGWHKIAAALQSYVGEPDFARIVIDSEALASLLHLRYESLSAGLKDGRRVANSVLTTLKNTFESQVEKAETAFLEETYKNSLADQAFQQKLIELFIVPHLQHYYFKGEDIDYSVIGSTARGTDGKVSLKAQEADIDVVFVGVPILSPASDWTARPQAMGEKKISLEDWTKVEKLGDPILIQLIESIKTAILEKLKRSSKFKYVRAWDDMNGVVFGITIEDGELITLGDITIAKGHTVDLDVILTHEKYMFGVAHSQQFLKELNKISEIHGGAVAGEALLNIRSLKGMCKLLAKDVQTGKDDKKKKVPGLVIEVCFINGSGKPRSMEELHLAVKGFEPSAESHMNEEIVAQEATLLDKEWTVSQLLSECPSVTKGGLQTLKKALDELLSTDGHYVGTLHDCKAS